MPNPFTSAYAPQVLGQQFQMPATNALQQQQAFQNAAMNQMQGLVGQAGQPAQGYTGTSALALANALRKGGKTVLSDEQKAEISQLGSSSMNPFSDYNRGTNGWGHYGE